MQGYKTIIKKKIKEIPNQRVGESKKKRKKIPNQRMGKSKKNRMREAKLVDFGG